MRAMKYEPGKPAELIDIENELKPLQDAVGGYIETVHLTRELIIIADEEGMLKGKTPNRWGLVGTFLVVGDGGEEFRGLTDTEVDFLKRRVL